MNSADSYRKFCVALGVATSRIEDVYYAPKVSGGARVRRERAYAYELYHQLRTVLAAGPLTLHGEMDKAAHPVIPTAVKPDLIVHQPGDMHENLVAVEVKCITSSTSNLLKDLGTLTFLRNVGEYKHAILLLFGGSFEYSRFIGRISATKRDRYGRLIEIEKVDVFLHESVASKAKLLSRIGF